MIKAVFFDVDGTLVDSNEQHVAAWAFAFQQAGKPQELSEIRAQIGKGGDLLVPALLPEISGELQRQIADAHTDLFEEAYLPHVRPFPGARELLLRVHANGRKVILATSAKRSELDHYIDLLQARDFIDAAISGGDVDTTKPAPDIFVSALEAANLRPEEGIVVGDTPYDVDGAGRAGLPTIAGCSGVFTERQLRDAGAVAVYANVAALLEDFELSLIARG